ncbi:hypothetical protein JFT60_10385 [Pseudomonas sp. MF6772]|uniref:hypothetical protein n=1 Tax=Pseudomonas sp. MF6772 TaxID=2797533 RepID=UPI0018E7A54A|nr:hypothetical protein [Pseudomonas sp. MF6772]MBJ2267776.1 hypothetical protein [Pseudomonas sp. MF6772]
MLMKPEHFDRLADKSVQVLSLRTRLIVTRRILREVLAQDEREKMILRMSIRQLKRKLPFTQGKLTEIEQLLRDCWKANRDILISYGQMLRDSHHAFEGDLGWEGLCDVLCVNRVHRGEAGEHDKGLFGLTWIGGQFEDSSTHYGSDVTGGGPITRAISAAMQEWMLKNMDKMPGPFAPGGPLYGLPLYTQQADGTMVMSTPAVTVHSADGSKVVGSKPRRAGKPVTPSKVATLFQDSENVLRHEN